MRGEALPAAVWSAVGFGGGQLLRFLFNMAATRLLSPELFGVMGLANVILMGLALLSDVGLGLTVVRERDSSNADFLRTVFSVQAVRGIGLGLMSIGVGQLAAGFYGDARLAWVVPVTSLGVVAAGFNATWLMRAVQALRLRGVVMLELGSQGVAGVAMVMWAWKRPGLEALMVGAVTAPVLKAVLSHVFADSRDGFGWSAEVWSRIIGVGRWVWANSVLLFLSAQSDRILLAKMISWNLLGTYGIALAISEMSRGLANAVSGNVLLPVYARMASGPRSGMLATIERQRWPVLWGIGLVVVTLGSTGDVVIRLIYDARYGEAGWMLPLLSLGIWPAALSTTSDGALLAIGKAQYGAWGNLGKLVFMLVGLPLGYAEFGLAGAVVVVVLNDVPVYVAILIGLRREKLWAWRQDLMASLVVFAVLLCVLWGRWMAGWGTPLAGIPGR